MSNVLYTCWLFMSYRNYSMLIHTLHLTKYFLSIYKILNMITLVFPESQSFCILKYKNLDWSRKRLICSLSLLLKRVFKLHSYAKFLLSNNFWICNKYFSGEKCTARNVNVLVHLSWYLLEVARRPSKLVYSKSRWC